jgi:hypothetical protein
MRQAFAGMLWSKQFYFYPVDKSMSSDILPPDCAKRVALRNKEWFHLESADILSMPDKWSILGLIPAGGFHCRLRAFPPKEIRKQKSGKARYQTVRLSNRLSPIYRQVVPTMRNDGYQFSQPCISADRRRCYGSLDYRCGGPR